MIAAFASKPARQAEGVYLEVIREGRRRVQQS